MKPRPVTMDKDINGSPYVRVPVARTEYEALVDLKDWERLVSLGYYGNVWAIKTPIGRIYPMLYAPTTKDETKRKATTLARAVLGALTEGERVTYKSGEPLDCRRSNLGIKTIRAK